MTMRLFAVLLSVILLGAGCMGPGLRVEVSAPSQVDAGKDVEISVQVFNDGTEEQSVASVALSGSLYEGLYAYGTRPPSVKNYTDAEHAYVAELEGVVVAPGSMAEVAVGVNAVWQGEYTGNVTVCFEGIETCEHAPLSMRIVEVE